ncbi:MAG: UDP-N-acetylenolpyruvoylglucosamine reductase, partial [bacterium]
MASLRNEIINELKSISGDRVKTNFSLSKYTSFGLGGNCAVFINVHSETELSHLLRFCFENGLKYFILGNGTNILVSDRGFDGVV